MFSGWKLLEIINCYGGFMSMLSMDLMRRARQEIMCDYGEDHLDFHILVDSKYQELTRDEEKQHQSKLKPEDNKFHQGNGVDKKHYWLTPPDVYNKLNMEFSFTFDPCPYPKPDDFDGLTCEWGQSSYVNPPFGSIMHTDPITGKTKKKGATAWARKAIAEHKKGKDVVLVHPIDKWVLMMIEAGAEIRNLGDVRWLATEDNSVGKGTGRHIAAFILKTSTTKSGE